MNDNLPSDITVEHINRFEAALSDLGPATRQSASWVCDLARAALAAQPGSVPEGAAPMTAARASFFMERFLKEEKLLGPNEQAALHFVIAMLAPTEAKPAQDAVDAERWRFAMDWGNFDWAVCRIDGDRYEQIENNEPIDAAISAKKVGAA